MMLNLKDKVILKNWLLAKSKKLNWPFVLDWEKSVDEFLMEVSNEVLLDWIRLRALLEKKQKIQNKSARTGFGLIYRFFAQGRKLHNQIAELQYKVDILDQFIFQLFKNKLITEEATKKANEILDQEIGVLLLMDYERLWVIEYLKPLIEIEVEVLKRELKEPDCKKAFDIHQAKISHLAKLTQDIRDHPSVRDEAAAMIMEEMQKKAGLLNLPEQIRNALYNILLEPFITVSVFNAHNQDERNVKKQFKMHPKLNEARKGIFEIHEYLDSISSEELIKIGKNLDMDGIVSMIPSKNDLDFVYQYRNHLYFRKLLEDRVKQQTDQIPVFHSHSVDRFLGAGTEEEDIKLITESLHKALIKQIKDKKLSYPGAFTFKEAKKYIQKFKYEIAKDLPRGSPDFTDFAGDKLDADIEAANKGQKRID